MQAEPAGIVRRTRVTGRLSSERWARARGLCRAQLRVPKQNPSVKMRVNAVNAMLRNQRQERKLLIHPKCRQLIKDFERVSWAADANGNILPQIDKSDPMRTHVSDALGYKLAD